MKGKFKEEKPLAPMVEEKYEINFTAEEEARMMEEFVNACKKASDISSQIRHDCFRAMMLQEYKKNLRVVFKDIIDPMVESWKNTPLKDMTWIEKLDKIKVSFNLELAGDAVSHAWKPEMLHEYKTSTVKVTIAEEEFDFTKKSFAESSLNLECEPALTATPFEDVEKEKSKMIISYELKSL